MVATTALKPGVAGRGEAPVPAVRFTRASVEHRESAYDETLSAAAFGSGPTNMADLEVPAHGYARFLTLLVESSGGAAGLATVAAQGDAPWSFIKTIAFKDVNGGFLVGPLTGYQLFLANKWGGYGYQDNPVSSPSYSTVNSAGNFSFILRLPLEVIARDALGALPNLNSSAQYRVSITAADDSDVYSTPPDTLPSVRVRAWLDAWSKPSATDPRGRPQATNPPASKVSSMWSVAQHSVSGSGTTTIKNSRVGNYIRHIGLIFRDATNVREGDTFPTSAITLALDGQPLEVETAAIRRDLMARRYGYTLAAISTADFDEAVLWYDFAHDFDGKPGGEIRDLWLPTVQSSRLEFTIESGEAGTWEILVNDVNIGAPVE